MRPARPSYFSQKAFRHFPAILLAVLLLATSSVFLAPGVSAANNPVPYVQILSPVSVHPGATGVTLTLIGTGFVSSSVVQWNGTALTTTFVTSQKLTAVIPDGFDAATGLGSITVVSPVGRTSNVMYFPVAAAEAGTTFPSTPTSSVSVGNAPTGVVTADFNGDGKLDLAVANSSDNTISVLLGNGNGTFTLKSTPAAGAGANWLAAGDFNEDGKLDLAIANVSSSGAGGVTILLGNGDGTFTAGTPLTAGSAPFSIVTADFNGDGHLDLAVVNSGAGTVSVFLGSGTGTFSLSATLTVGSLPQVIVTGDFNEDGKLDLAVANENDNTVSILLGNGNGTFAAQSVISSGGTSGLPIGLIAADFNGDNHLDLAAVNASDVGILLGNGNGTFTLHSDPTTGSGDLITGVAGDFNGDGKLDLVVSDQDAGEAFLLPGQGNGNFGSAVTFTTASGAYGVATADFNGDGALDLAISNTDANNVSIFLQMLPVVINPTSLAYGNQNLGTTSASKTATLTNHSGAAITGITMNISGSSADFSGGASTTCGSSLANGASCTVTLSFTPQATGARSATLSISDSGGNSPQTVALTGTGVASPPTISKAFGASQIPVNGSTSLTFTITNTISSTALTGVSFSDSFPAGLVVATPNGLSGSCGSGTITATAAAGSVSLSGGTLAASASCSFSVNVTGTSQGILANTTGAVSSNETGAGATSNTANITVVGPPNFSKNFGAASVAINGTTTLNFFMQNSNFSAVLTGVSFLDTFPSGLVVATPNGLSNPCGGTFTATPGASSVTLSGASLAGNSNCTITINVTATSAGTKNNVTGAITTTNGGTGGTASASLSVTAPPTISKAFGASSIASGGTTSLSFTITNPAANAVALTGVAFTDVFPAGLLIATPNGLAGSCGGGTITATAGGASVTLSGATLAVSASCTFSVNVTSSAADSYTNTTNAVTSANGGTGGTASASLAVVAPPVITKTFGAANVPLNGTTSLTFTITNPAANTVSLTGVGFTDNVPAGLQVDTPSLMGSCGSGSITLTAGSVSLSGATFATNATCTLTINVTGTSAGVKNNSVTVTSTNAGTGNTSNASLTVVAPPVITKAFGAASVPLNGATSLTFTIQNNNTAQSLSGVSFTDTLPAGLLVSTPNGLAGSCGGGTITAAAGSNSAGLSGATLAASTSCTFSINVTGTAAGTQNNTTGAVTSTAGGTGGTASASVNVVAPPSIAKAFGAATIQPGASTSLTFTITNPASNAVALTGVAFSDAFPSGIVVATPNGLTGSCGAGTITATAGSVSTSLSGGTIAANSSCTFAVNITGATGNYTNTTGAVTSTNGGTGNTASASLSVNQPAAITSANNATFVVGSAGTFTVTDTGMPTPTLSESGSLPNGVSFNTANGVLSGTPAAATGGTYPITFTAHNGAGADATQNFTLTVDQAAAITSANTATFTVGSASTFNVTATGTPTPTLSESGALPVGVTFNTATGALAGTPAAGTGGSYPVTFTAHNGTGADAVQNFSLVVQQTSMITSASSTTFTVGTFGTFNFTSSGLPAPTFSLSGALPNGVTFTDHGNGTATLSGTPAATTGGTYTLTITAHNGSGPDSVQTFTLTVNQAPAITSANSTTFAFGTAGSFTVTAMGFPAPSISTASALPSGLTLVDNHNGTATLSGTPQQGSGGSTAIALVAANTTAPNATQNFTLTVSRATPALNWATPAPITFGTALSSTQLDASANVAGSFAYSPASGTVLDAGPQLLSVTFSPTDSTDYTTATGNVTLTVNKATPTITWATPAAIAYGTALSSSQLDASASVAGTFTYTPAAGAILNAGPQMLSASFTPTDASDDSNATAQVALTVNPAASATALTASSASTGLGASVTFTATVTSAAGTPAGSATFFDGATSLGAANLTSGAASFSTSTLAAGPHSISASYSGSGNFNPSSSTTVTETIVPPTFSVASSVPQPVVQAGQAAVVPITLTAKGGFTGTIQFSITGLPAQTSVTFNPTTIALGATPATDTLTILTTPRFDYLSRIAPAPSHPVYLAGPIYIAGLFLPIAGLVFGGAGLAFRRNRRSIVWLVLLLLCVGSGLLSGCTAYSPAKDAGTPAGTYSLLVTATATTATGNVTQTITVTLVVR